MKIAVYCASSALVDGVYLQAAQDLGHLLAEHGHTLVFGGADLGLMGALARAAKASGGQVVGVIPRRLADRDLAYRGADTLIVTATMAERKARMEELADGFLALPGGFGTLEELAEVITLKQLHYLDGAIALVNTAGFYRHLLAHLEHLVTSSFAYAAYRDLYVAVDKPAEAIAHVESWVPRALPEKWEVPAG